eukprot:TRINITY_DN820_c0_g1_i10.p1 TRINITY_DN820_c0_g1~~TRINITY_DN820_c0_g1_i10.p1  ORF type:complete len:425 (-),score=82.69 TRINITY_DN820_c0_g1_i10:33-1307(-)
MKPKTKAIGYFGIDKTNIVLVMVGLPARGKTYIARKMARYLNWLGVVTKVFNVGVYRRERLGAKQPPSFFDPTNANGKKARHHMSVAALDDMIEWLTSEGRVAIFDATNTTKERRTLILERCEHEHLKVMFVESVCEDPVLIESNVRETKLFSPDYAGQDKEEAAVDFRNRIEMYRSAYQPIDDSDDALSYVKMFDVGKKVVVNNVDGYLCGRMVTFLMNLHITPRPIWICRHGQSMDNVAGKIGGDSQLSPTGEQFAQLLAEWVSAQKVAGKVTVWTSTLKRTIQTSQYIPKPKVHLRALDEIDAGRCEGLTYDDIASRYPEEYANRASNKLSYRYPGGESYEDVIGRLEPVCMELERQRSPVLIVAHQAVIRALYGYFMNTDPHEVPYIPVPLHTVIELRQKAYGCDETRHSLLELHDTSDV